MAKKVSEWNKLVQKKFKAGKAKDANYSFKQALKDASKSHTGGADEPAHSNEEVLPLHNGGNDAVGVNDPVGATDTSTLSGSPFQKAGRRRSKKHRSHHKKRGKSHKNQKHTRRH